MFVIVNGALQFVDDSVLAHHGVKGMKWGVRRYQNPDGSLTDKGKKRYAKSIQKAAKNTSYGAREKLQEDIAYDLGNRMGIPGSSKVRTHISNINAKREALVKELSDPSNEVGEGKSLPESAQKASREYAKACMQAANDILGQYGNTPVRSIKNSDTSSVSDIVSYTLERRSHVVDKHIRNADTALENAIDAFIAEMNASGKR